MDNIGSKIEAIVDRLVHMLNRVAKLEGYDDILPKPHLPASREEILAYEKYLGLKLPKSYRAFLELYNGYDWLAFSGHMLAVQDAMPGGRFYNYIQDWKKRCARYGAGEVLDGVVIAELGGPNRWVYIDPNKASSEREFTVVYWEPEFETEYPNLIEFFQGRIELCELVMREAGS